MDAFTRHNFYQRIRSRNPMLGAFCPAPSSELIEVAAYAGFDFAVVDAEHGAISINDIVHMVRAGHGAGIAIMVRVPEATSDLVTRSLDAGADGLVFPQVESAEQAADIVSRTHFPPRGVRGVAPYTRAFQYMKNAGQAAMDSANERVVTGAIIESPKGVENVDDIARVDGVDLLLLGQNDLAANIGRVPNLEEQINAAVLRISEAGTKNGVSTSAAAQSADAAIEFSRLGYSIVVTGLLPPLLRASSEFVNKTRAGVSAPI